MSLQSIANYSLEPLGDSALLLRFSKEISVATHERVMGLKRLIEQHAFPGMVEVVISYAALAVHYDPIVVLQRNQVDDCAVSTSYQVVARYVEEIMMQYSETSYNKEQSQTVIEVPVCYGGTYGPDLAELAGACQLSEKDVIAIHSKESYLIYMLGFAPGFPYLGELDKRIAYKRKDIPRTLVPAGSVGIADAQTGIYPFAMPGGWNIIGRTPLTLFAANQEPPSLLSAGQRITFVPITEAEFAQYVIEKEQQ